jgi:Cu/Zn superoxide dismutase
MTQEFDLLTINGDNSVVGRAVVIHANQDTGEQPTGNVC